MICFVSIEHEGWLEDPETRVSDFSYCMDVKLKLEELAGMPCIVQRYTDLTQERLDDLEPVALIISGNGTDWEHYDLTKLAVLFGIVRGAQWPILGFCGGLQLIAMAHGATVAPIRRLRPGEFDIAPQSAPGFLKERGFYPVEVTAADPLLDGLGRSPVFLQAHYCEVKAPPPNFKVLASSEACSIQVMKQRDRPIYGVQFHPEGYTEWPQDRRNPLVNAIYPEGHTQARPDGRALLSNFFRIIGVSS